MSNKSRANNFPIDVWTKTKKEELQKEKLYILIVSLIEERYNVTFADLSKKSRKRTFVIPRQLIYHSLKKHTKSYSLFVIGALFKQDHATVSHAYKTIEELIDTDKDLNDFIYSIEFMVREFKNSLQKSKKAVFSDLLSTCGLNELEEIEWLKTFIKAI